MNNQVSIRPWKAAQQSLHDTLHFLENGNSEKSHCEMRLSKQRLLKEWGVNTFFYFYFYFFHNLF